MLVVDLDGHSQQELVIARMPGAGLSPDMNGGGPVTRLCWTLAYGWTHMTISHYIHTSHYPH